MSTYETSVERSTAVRPRTILLGIDEAGAHHVWRTRRDVVHVVHPDRGRTHRQRLRGHSIEEYMAHVESQRGFADPRYGVSFIDMLAEAFEG